MVLRQNFDAGSLSHTYLISLDKLPKIEKYFLKQAFTKQNSFFVYLKKDIERVYSNVR